MSKLKELQGKLVNLEKGYEAKKKKLAGLKNRGKLNQEDQKSLKALQQQVQSYPKIIATTKKAIASLEKGSKSSAAQASNQKRKYTAVKKRQDNKMTKPKSSSPFSSGVKATYTHGKKMYISLDVHKYNDVKSIKAVLDKFPNINFTLYLFEEDKKRIPSLITSFPKASLGLHLDPNSSVETIDSFYTYIRKYQPIDRTPASVHGVGKGKFDSSLLKKLKSYNIPFVRSANSKGSDTIMTKDAPAIKNVIGATAPVTKIKESNYNQYYTHPHEVKKGVNNQYGNLEYFDKGVGK